MAQSLIRWRQGDYIKLGKAVAEFNRKVKALEQQQGALGLPELIDYQELKAEIVTRKELNRQLDLLRSFKESGMEELLTVNDEVITVWEKQNIEREQKRILRSLDKEIKQVEQNQFGMGINKFKTLQARKQAVINFDRNLIKKLARTDFEMKKAIQYRENVIEQFDELPEEFDNIKEYLLSIKNPMKFYEEMQKSQTLQNYFDWYKNPANFGSFSSDEDIANYIEDELEI